MNTEGERVWSRSDNVASRVPDAPQLDSAGNVAGVSGRRISRYRVSGEKLFCHDRSRLQNEDRIEKSCFRVRKDVGEGERGAALESPLRSDEWRP